MILGSAPEPVEVLTGRRSAVGKTVFPPPLGRSPIKTAIGSSPRRQSSVGPFSPVRSLAQSPLRNGRAGSHPMVARRLDFSSQDETILRSVEKSPKQTILRKGRSAGRPQRNIFGLHPSPGLIEEKDANSPIPEETAESPTSYSPTNGVHDTTSLPHQDDSLQLLDQNIDLNGTNGVDDEGSYHAPIDLPSDEPEEDQSRSRNGSTLRKTARAPRSPAGSRELERALRQGSYDSAKDEAYQPEPNMDDADEETEPAELSPAPPPKKKGRGRGRKPDKVIIHEDDGSSTASGSKKRKALKPAPSERGPNAKIVGTKRQKSDPVSVAGVVAPAQENRRPGPRSLQILRQGTPADEEGMQTTRFGRASVKPVAWWCGERVDRDYDGTIKNIVRAQSVEPAKRAGKPNNKKQPSRAKPETTVVEEEDEDEDIEDWELDPGVVTGPVRIWDPEQGAGVEESDNEMGKSFSCKESW